MAKRVFLSHAPADERFRDELEKHLAPLRRAGAAVLWHDRELLGGDPSREVIAAQIDAAEVILLLVTPDFLASEELHDEQVQRALARRETGGTRVVPVLVRPCAWEVGALARLEPLPRNRVPVASWSDRDAAWTEVVKGVLALFSEGRPRDAAEGASMQNEARAGEGAPVQNEVRELEKLLQSARDRKKKLKRVGASEALRAVDAEILTLRRKLRERGQLAVGDALSNDRYVLVELLGKGGFATVWRAYDDHTGTEVALKVLHPQLMREEIRRERFFRGARVMASLNHPGIVRVLEPEGHDRGFDYFVMELVRGGTLRDAVLKGRLDGAAILDVLSKVGDALSAAHAAGHVHRDVKPANILLDEEGNPRLTDFDLVGGGDTTGGTGTGVLLGTIVYAAPEAMVNASDADARADVYGLGMTGVFCYQGKDLPLSIMRDVGSVIRKLPCPDEVRGALATATEWEVGHRWPDVRSFCDALRPPPPSEPPPTVIRRPTTLVERPAEVASTPPPASPSVTPALTWRASSSGVVAPPAEEDLSWATERGEDQFGWFVSFSVEGAVQRMRWIPPGRFLMGSPEGEAGRYTDEGPQHEVEMSRGFWLADTPCMQALWHAVMRSNPSRFRSPNRPVETVSWNECQAFLQELNSRVSGLRARLPSEAEWEYACRGGTTAATWLGDLDVVGKNNAPVLDEIAWYGGNSGVGFELGNGEDSGGWSEKQYPHMRAGTRSVGRKQANPLGLHDMLGNVWEWCEDRWGSYEAARAIEPPGPLTGLSRVIRGGSWLSGARDVRAACRLAGDPGGRSGHLGFRLARGQVL